MKKGFIYVAAALALLTAGCSKGRSSADSAESAQAAMVQLEAERSQGLNDFKNKVIDAMAVTTEKVKADPENAKAIYSEYRSRMIDLHLNNAEFMQELLLDTTFISEGNKFRAAMAEAGINTTPLDTEAPMAADTQVQEKTDDK